MMITLISVKKGLPASISIVFYRIIYVKMRKLYKIKSSACFKCFHVQFIKGKKTFERICVPSWPPFQSFGCAYVSTKTLSNNFPAHM